MGKYRFGFSLTGLLLYALQLLPNLLWIAAPPANDVLKGNSSPVPIWNIVEQVFGCLTVALLILLKNRDGGRNGGHYLGGAVLFLAAYYLAWIFYYRGIVSPWLLVLGLAAMPPLYFLSAALWIKNYVVLVPCIIFGATHIAITCANYLKL